MNIYVLLRSENIIATPNPSSTEFSFAKGLAKGKLVELVEGH